MHLVAEHLYSYYKKIRTQNRILHTISAKWENYTCSDCTRPTINPIASSSWTDVKTNKTYPIQLLHSRAASKVHIIDNFATDEECFALGKAAQNNLHLATTEDDTPGEPSKYHETGDNTKRLGDKYLSCQPLLDYVEMVYKQFIKCTIPLPT